MRRTLGFSIKIRRVEVIVPSNADQRKQRISAGIGQCGAHALGGGHFTGFLRRLSPMVRSRSVTAMSGIVQILTEQSVVAKPPIH